MEKEAMVPVRFANGYVTEMRKSLADRHIKDKVVVSATAQELAIYRGLTLPKPEKPVTSTPPAGQGAAPPAPQGNGKPAGGK